MKLKKNDKIVVNRTSLYLLPALRKYGEGYRENLSIVFKKAFGIKDVVDNRNGENIYILVDTSVNTKVFIRVLNWIKTKPYYIADYEFDDLLDGTLHMLVLHVPSSQAYDNFMLGKYGKMYDGSDLKKFIDSDSIILGVLARHEDTTKRYVDEINKEWGTKFKYSEWTGELDYPWKEEEEVFDVESPRKVLKLQDSIDTVTTSGVEEATGEVGLYPIDS